MKARKKKRRRRIIRVLLAVLFLMVLGLSVLLHGPVKTLSSLEKVADFPLDVMRYQCMYFFDLFVEVGTYRAVYRKIYEKVNFGQHRLVDCLQSEYGPNPTGPWKRLRTCA